MSSQPDRPPPPGSPVAPVLEHPAPFRLDRRPPPPPSPFAGHLATVEGLGRAVRCLLVISVVLSVVDAVLELYLIRAFARSPVLGGLPANGAQVYDIAMLILLINLCVFVAIGVCVMVLFKRMMENGAVLSPGHAVHRSHWAITGWLVPILSLVRPFQVVRQIWETSRCGVPEVDGRRLPVTTRIWWGLFLVSNSVAFAVPSAPIDGSATIHDFADEAVGRLAVSLIQAAAGIAFLALLASLIPRHRLAIRSM